MSDPKLVGAPILKNTLCRVEGHVVIYTGNQWSNPTGEEPCSCGQYTLAEIQEQWPMPAPR